MPTSGETKNGEGRTLPIYGEMREWLKMQKEIRDAKYPECDPRFLDDGRPAGDFPVRLPASGLSWKLPVP